MPEEQKKPAENKKQEYAQAGSPLNQFVLVCGHCSNHDNGHMVVEINFADKAMYYKCSKCKKMNILDFSLLHPAPYPKMVVSRI